MLDDTSPRLDDIPMDLANELLAAKGHLAGTPERDSSEVK
jgi:hypothetical protein